MSRPASLLVLLPSLRISGGVAEALKLSRELQARGVAIQVVAFWKHEHELDTDGLPVEHLCDKLPDRSSALLQLPGMALRFMQFAWRWRRSQPGYAGLLLTHFTTFFFAWLQPQLPRVCFNQDQEWLFMAEGLKRDLLKKVILFTSRRSTVLAANHYIADKFEQQDVPVFGEVSIWADSQWLASEVSEHRDVDVTMLLRMSSCKRLDLHLTLLRLLHTQPGLRISVVTPDADIVPMAKEVAHEVLLRPSNAALKDLFASTRLFVLMSDVEGFGLPPLEAAGSGAIPVCRDSGGVRNYMQGIFAPQLVPQSETLEATRDRILRLLSGEGTPSPEEARSVFEQGLLLSRKTRDATLDRASALLRSDNVN